MDPEELRRVELAFERGQRAREQEFTGFRVHAAVLARSFDPCDVADRQREHPPANADRHLVGIARCRSARHRRHDIVDRGRGGCDLERELGDAPLGDPSPHAAQAKRNALPLHRLDEAIDGFQLERRQGEFRMRGHDHEAGPAIGLAQRLDVAGLRHVDVEQDEIGPQFPDLQSRLHGAGRFVDGFELADGLELRAKLAPSRFIARRDQHAQSTSGSCRHSAK